MGRDWKAGKPVPERYSGMPVTFSWNDVALTHLLRALEKDYPSGYIAMCDHVREAMANFTPPRPEEPTGLGAVVEDENGRKWVRIEEATERDLVCPWRGPSGHENYADITAVRVLSEGVVA